MADVTRIVADLDRRLEKDPGDIALQFDRAGCLDALGRIDEALAGYRRVLAADPHHFLAHNAIATLLAEREPATAQNLFKRVVAEHPDRAIGHSNLAFTYLRDGQLAQAKTHYATALALDPQLAIAHNGLAKVLDRLGDHAGARQHRERGARLQPVATRRFVGATEPIEILQLATIANGNTVTDEILDPAVFRTTVLLVEYFDPSLPLPPHHLLFNAIGESDGCSQALMRAAELAKKTAAPIINSPASVLATGRAVNADRLRRIPGVRTAEVAAFSRSELVSARADLLEKHGFSYPFLMRAPGFHNGSHFCMVTSAADLLPSLEALPGDTVLVMQYLDARDADGTVRKFRVMIIDGNLYPLHLALSRDWKVHFITADMAGEPAHRAVDAAFLADMHGFLGPQVIATLQAIAAELRLDYAGIDFSVDADNNVLVFEANATMTIVRPDSDARWDYRRAPVQCAFEAARNMLIARLK